MYVMIFVTQNNFKTVQEFPTVSLDFTEMRLAKRVDNFVNNEIILIFFFFLNTQIYLCNLAKTDL